MWTSRWNELNLTTFIHQTCCGYSCSGYSRLISWHMTDTDLQHMYMHIYIYEFVCVCIYIYIFVLSIYLSLSIHIYIYIYIFIKRQHEHLEFDLSLLLFLRGEFPSEKGSPWTHRQSVGHWKSTMISEVSISGVQSFAPTTRDPSARLLSQPRSAKCRDVY